LSGIERETRRPGKVGKGQESGEPKNKPNQT